MNFCEDFANIQSIFNYCNEFVKPMQRLQIRGGNMSLKLSVNGVDQINQMFLFRK